MAKKLTLKGCPCCGSKAYWCKGNKETRMNDLVQCLECSLMMKGDYIPQSALDKWNWRVMDYIIQKNDREVNIDGDNL